jgi:hypothetical protein
MATQSEPEIVLDVFLARERGAYRFYIAYTSWCPPALKTRAGQDFEIYPVAWPDLVELEQQLVTQPVVDADRPLGETFSPTNADRPVANSTTDRSKNN